MTKIEWTERTWNPIVGCSVVSPGCTNCYAMRMAGRLGANPATPHYAGLTETHKGKPVWTGRIAAAPEAVWTAPLRRKTPTTWFVNSMGDLFHEKVPDNWIDRVFAIMALCPQHRFQVLTKRAARMRDYVQVVGGGDAERWRMALRHQPSRIGALALGDALEYLTRRGPLSNVWLGVSAEDQARAEERIPLLLDTPAAIRFVSCEPLLGPVNLHWLYKRGTNGLDALRGETEERETGDPVACNRLDWVICGGESGPGARPMHPDWARSLRDQCQAAEVPFFFKQHGEWIGESDLRALPGGGGPGFGVYDHCPHDMDAEVVRVGRARAGRLLDGREWNEMPGAGSVAP